MCGRYTVGVSSQELLESLSVSFPESEAWRSRYSMAPRQPGLVITEQPDAAGELAPVMRKAAWGIKGAVWNKPDINSINAREDSLFKVAKWRELLRGAGATALIPMTGYAEFVAPRSDPSLKVPVFNLR
ncbi:SOS response-associated peptidase family protein [Arthrobacter woluwensis]|uniref:SOS response-associated peptidase family protein n=1 Tax=Arthrobacter woluwensis TaxID=156980 RepID=UPI00380DA1DE